MGVAEVTAGCFSFGAAIRVIWYPPSLERARLGRECRGEQRGRWIGRNSRGSIVRECGRHRRAGDAPDWKGARVARAVAEANPVRYAGLVRLSRRERAG